jgi:hypothetical protein
VAANVPNLLHARAGDLRLPAGELKCLRVWGHWLMVQPLLEPQAGPTGGQQALTSEWPPWQDPMKDKDTFMERYLQGRS